MEPARQHSGCGLVEAPFHEAPASASCGPAKETWACGLVLGSVLRVLRGVWSQCCPSSNLRFLSLQVERIPSSPSALVFQELEPGLAQLADEIAVAPGHGVGGVVEAEVVLGHVDGAVGANALDAPGGQLLAAGLQACLVQAPDAVVGDLEGSALVLGVESLLELFVGGVAVDLLVHHHSLRELGAPAPLGGGVADGEKHHREHASRKLEHLAELGEAFQHGADVAGAQADAVGGGADVLGGDDGVLEGDPEVAEGAVRCEGASLRWAQRRERCQSMQKRRLTGARAMNCWLPQRRRASGRLSGCG